MAGFSSSEKTEQIYDDLCDHDDHHRKSYHTFLMALQAQHFTTNTMFSWFSNPFTQLSSNLLNRIQTPHSWPRERHPPVSFAIMPLRASFNINASSLLRAATRSSGLVAPSFNRSCAFGLRSFSASSRDMAITAYFDVEYTDAAIENQAKKEGTQPKLTSQQGNGELQQLTWRSKTCQDQLQALQRTSS